MPEATFYGASKLALEGYTRSAAAELGRWGITVNAVSLGPVQAGWIPPELEQEILPTIPIGKPRRSLSFCGLLIDLAQRIANILLKFAQPGRRAVREGVAKFFPQIGNTFRQSIEGAIFTFGYEGRNRVETFRNTGLAQHIVHQAFGDRDLGVAISEAIRKSVRHEAGDIGELLSDVAHSDRQRRTKVQGIGDFRILRIQVRRRYDQTGNLVVGRPRQDLLRDEIRFGSVGSSSDDLLRVNLADAWKCLQFIQTSRIQIKQCRG